MRPSRIRTKSKLIKSIILGHGFALAPLALSAQVHFSDQTQAAGIAYDNVCGDLDKRYVLEAHGNGAAFFDADNDGDLDLYLPNGATFSTYLDQSGPGNQFYLNDGEGHYADHSAASGADHAGWGTGIAVGDVDNDGDRDLYVTNFGANMLYLNEGRGTFVDGTQAAGTAGDDFSASSAFFDYDNDGDLDLYVTNYVVFDAENRPADPQLCTFYGGLQVYCGPKGLVGAPDVLYRNEGNGVFTDVTEASGIGRANRYYGLGVVPEDYNGDGLLDLFVANDETPNVLFHNRGDGTFEDVALMAGVAYNADGDTEAGMGVDFADYDNDGDPDVYVTHFFSETNTLYRNEGGLRFTDVTTTAGLAGPTIDLMGWGTRFFDFDNDGLLDVFVANGHVYPQVDRIDTGSRYRQPNQLFSNVGNGRFKQVEAARALALEQVSRGAAFGDYDNDGDFDILVVNLNDRAVLMRNEGGNRQNWLYVQLIGRADSRDGVGALIEVTSGDVRQRRRINGAGSYLSHSDLRAQFGLGAAERIDAVDITWPNGTNQRLLDLAANQLLVVHQGGSHSAINLRSNPYTIQP